MFPGYPNPEEKSALNGEFQVLFGFSEHAWQLQSKGTHTLPHHYTGKSLHELITSRRDNKGIKFTECTDTVSLRGSGRLSDRTESYPEEQRRKGGPSHTVRVIISHISAVCCVCAQGADSKQEHALSRAAAADRVLRRWVT